MKEYWSQTIVSVMKFTKRERERWSRERERGGILAVSLNCDNTHHLWLKRAHPTGTITTKLQWQEKNMLINVTKWNK